MYRKGLKSIFDFLIAFFGLLLISPLFLAIMICLFIANNGKPFFFQSRPGYRGRLFNIVKFKTMNDKRDAKGNLLSDSERLTMIGKFVRKTSLDEVPQLINVLKGDMSLIGPRPLLPQYLELYTDKQAKRHNVKPGITGWAQVNGRNAISWSQKFAFDVWYVENVSFKVDIKIILLTIKKVLLSEGINTVGQATTEPFNGKN